MNETWWILDQILYSVAGERSLKAKEAGGAEHDDTKIELNINVDIDGKPEKSVHIPFLIPNARGNTFKRFWKH